VSAQVASVASPDGRLLVNIDVKGGKPLYEVKYEGKQVLDESPLGFVADNGDFTQGITFDSKKEEHLVFDYEMSRSKFSHVHVDANQLVVTLKNAQGNTNVVKTADLDVLGGNFREITKEQKEQLGVNYGLEVTKVNNGALKNAGVPKGFIIQKVNDQPMKTLDELQDAVKSASTSKEPVLFIQGIFSTGKKAYYAVPLEEGK
jgi:S1-C subfamily serine protease